MLQRGGPGLSRSLRRPGPFFSGPDNDRVDSLVVRASAPTKATAASGSLTTLTKPGRLVRARPSLSRFGLVC